MIVVDWFDLIFVGLVILGIVLLPFIGIIDRIAVMVSKRQQKRIDEAFKDEEDNGER